MNKINKKVQHKKYRIGVLFVLLFLINSFLSHASSNIDVILDEANVLRSSDPEKSSLLLTTLNNQKQQMSSQQLFYFDYLIAYQNIYNGKTVEAESKLKQLLSSDAQDIIKFRSRHSLINIYAIEQKWKEGLYHLSKLLNEQRANKAENLAQVKENTNAIAAIFYNQLGQYELGLKYAKSFKGTANTTRNECFAEVLIIESLLHLEKLTQYTEIIDSTFSQCNSEPLVTYFIKNYLAKNDLRNNLTSKAISRISPVLSKIEATKNPRLIVEVYEVLSESYFKNTNVEKAKKFALKAIQVGENIPTTQAVVKAYELLYQIASQEKNYQQALTYHEEYTRLNEIVLDDIKAKHLAYQLAQHQALEQESKIKLLNEKNALLTAEKALDKAKVSNIQLFIAILALVLIALVVTIARLWESRNHIKALAEYDDLTGIYNRRHYSHITKSALTYCENAKQDLSLIMFDLDLFKIVNDTYGHACGDWALKEVTKVCLNIGRQNDIFARVGGEEFVIVLPSCGIDEAMMRAEACRVAIEEIITEASGFDFTITASFGVTGVKRSGFKLEQLMADADASAYISKRNGRNQITKFETEKNS